MKKREPVFGSFLMCFGLQKIKRLSRIGCNEDCGLMDLKLSKALKMLRNAMCSL